MAQRLFFFEIFERSLLRILGISALVALLYGTAAASSGKYALDFLNLPAGASAAAFGNAGYAGIEGPEAIFGNSSLLGAKSGVFACHQELLLDTRSDAFAVGFGLNDRLSMGAAFQLFNPGDIKGYSTDNISTGRIAAGDRLFKLALAMRGRFNYGLSVSYYNQRLGDVIGNGMGFGAGMTYETSRGRFAVTGDNIGPDFRIGNSSSPLPQRYSLSGWIPLYENVINLNLDLTYNRALGIISSGALEYNPSSSFGLRIGGNDADLVSMGARFSSGRVSLDYAFIPRGLFGSRHIFDLTISR